MKTVRLDIKSTFASLSGSRKMRFLSFSAGGSSLPIVDLSVPLPRRWEWPGFHGALTGTQAPPSHPSASDADQTRVFSMLPFLSLFSCF